MTGPRPLGGKWGGSETEGDLLNRIYCDSWDLQLKCDRMIWASPLSISLSWKRSGQEGWMAAWKHDGVHERIKNEKRKQIIRRRGKKSKNQREPTARLQSPSHCTCELQAQTRPCTKPEGSAAPGAPLPPAPSLLTRLCSVVILILSPRNLLNRMSLNNYTNLPSPPCWDQI